MDNLCLENNASLKKILFKSLFIVFCIMLSYVINRYFMLIPLVFSCYYIFFAKDDTQSTILLIFLFFFSTVFKIQSDQTSLFFVVKLAYVFRALYKGYLNKIGKPILMEFIFIAYCVLNMLYFETDAIVRIINLVIWMLIVYLLLIKTKIDKSLINKFAVIAFFVSCLIAKIGEHIPSFSEEIASELSSYDVVYGGEIDRYTGIFGDPNAVSIYVILCLFILLQLLRNNELSSTIFLSGSTVLTMIGLLTGSKSCFLLLIIYWFVFFISKTQKIALKILLLIATTYIILTFSTTNLYDLFYFRFFGGASGITTGRTDIWETYISYLNQGGISNWLIGFGINTANLPDGRAAHNVFIQIIYNLGVIGLVLYLAYWLFIIKAYSKKIGNLNSNILQIFLMYMPLFCIIATAFFLDAFFLEGYFFAIALALLLIPSGNTNTINRI